jgi:NitT/TauT family transport system ATP-binding protein
MIAGFEKPSSGTVTVDGQLITAPGSERGVVFQQANLMPWLPVWENVGFHLLLRKAARRPCAAKQHSAISTWSGSRDLKIIIRPNCQAA